MALGLGKSEAKIMHPAPAAVIATNHKLMLLSDLHFGAHTSGSCAPKCKSERCINLWVVAIANAGAGCKTPASFLPSPSALSASTFNDGGTGAAS